MSLPKLIIYGAIFGHNYNSPLGYVSISFAILQTEIFAHSFCSIAQPGWGASLNTHLYVLKHWV